MQWKHTKGISVVPFYKLNQRSLFLVSPVPFTPPSLLPPTFLVSLLCVGRSSTLAVHVFTNVSEYLIVIIPLSSAWRRLSVSKAELHSCGYCCCYFKKLYDYLFSFDRSAHFQVKEDKFQGWCKKLKGMVGEAYFLSDIGLCQHYDGSLLLLQGKTNCCDIVFIFSLFSTYVLWF